MLQLRDNQIDIWLVFYREIVDEPLLALMSAIMSASERSRQARFHLAEDRKRFMVTRAMARAVLSYYAPVAPTSWTFSNNEYGRPQIADQHELSDRPVFNLSHTSGLIVMAVGCRRDLGIDVENVSTEGISSDIAEKFFSRSEITDLALEWSLDEKTEVGLDSRWKEHDQRRCGNRDHFQAPRFALASLQSERNLGTSDLLLLL